MKKLTEKAPTRSVGNVLAVAEFFTDPGRGLKGSVQACGRALAVLLVSGTTVNLNLNLPKCPPNI